MTTKCPRCNLENMVKIYGVWKCPGCGFTSDNKELTTPYLKKITISERTVSKPILRPMISSGLPGSLSKKKKIADKNAGISVKKIIANRRPDDKKLHEELVRIVNDISGFSGWADLSKVGIEIRKIQPDFDSRIYGCKKFSELILKTGLFDIREQQSSNSQAKFLFIRKKAR